MAKAAKDKNEYRGVDMLKDDLRREIQQFLLTSKEHFLQLHGGRGSGKTYTTQKTVIEDCILNDVEFCFAVPTKKLRDSGSLKKWVSKVMAREFPEYQISLHNLQSNDRRQKIPLKQFSMYHSSIRLRADRSVPEQQLLHESVSDNDVAL